MTTSLTAPAGTAEELERQAVAGIVRVGDDAGPYARTFLLPQPHRRHAVAHHLQRPEHAELEQLSRPRRS